MPSSTMNRADGHPPSLAAELFLIAIDPATGRLVKRRRRRFRKALATCHGASWPGAATVARRAAVKELRAARLIEPSALPARYPLVPQSGATKPFGRVRRGAEYGFETERDVALFVFSAWSGILARRLTRGEREAARRRLRRLHDGGFPPIPQVAEGIGAVGYGLDISFVRESITDLLTGDVSSFDLSGGLAGGDGSGFPDGGGHHGGGGHHHGG